MWLKRTPTSKNDWFLNIILGSIALTGLFLVHYRVIAFLGLLLLADWITQVRIPIRGFSDKIGQTAKYLFALGLGSFFLSLPWLVPTLRDFFIPLGQRWSAGTGNLSAINLRYLTPALGIPALILAGLGLTLGIIKRKQIALTVLLWVAALFLIANPSSFHIPFPKGFVNQSSVEIMLFMPIAVLGGYFVGEVISWLEKIVPSRWEIIGKGIFLFLGTGVMILGAQRLMPTLNPVTFLFRETDYAAMTWIKESIPDDEVIVINPTGWGYGLYMGNDGGYWISALTDHPTMPPPALYGWSIEKRDEVNGFVEALLPIGEDAVAIHNLLVKHGYNYIYNGGRGGEISPKALKESDFFEPVFNYKNTWVFQIRP
jgi:hypothetical protein